jgi:hypothetical protein
MRLQSIVGIGISVLVIIFGVGIALHYIPYPD